jgi:hypothetical protein
MMMESKVTINAGNFAAATIVSNQDQQPINGAKPSNKTQDQDQQKEAIECNSGI